MGHFREKTFSSYSFSNWETIPRVLESPNKYLGRLEARFLI